MHLAYNVQSVLKQGVQIESIAAYGNNVILGTRSGQLIMYSVEESGSVDMLMFNKNFSKKAIVQMKVIAAEHLLFVLTDNMIHVCDISSIKSNFNFIHSSKATKGCSLFTLDVKTPKSTTGETTTVIRVCCAIKRRLEMFYWKLDSLHSPAFSIELKDIPKALCWVDDVICVGFKDEYIIYNISSNIPEKHDLIVTSSSLSLDPCICLLKNNILGISKDEFLIAIDPTEFVKRPDSKSMTQGNISVNTTGGISKHLFKPMMWSSPLMDLVWDEPYAIGRLANSIEIRCLDNNNITKDTLVQVLPELTKTKFLIQSEKGTIFAAATSELWCIRLADIQIQRHQLLQEKKFQLAIELTHISSEVEEVKSETIRQIHMRYAKDLFANKHFSAAMTEFEKAVADPYDVIRLFPNLLNDQSKKTNADGSEILVPKVPVIQLEDKDLEIAIMALIQFLTTARQKEVVKLRDTKSSSKSLLSIIDTTLLKCYLQTNDSLVAPLLRLNQCHLEESEKTLKKHSKISELVILYQMNGKHKEALHLLKSQAHIEGSILQGYNRTVRYLQQLGASYLQIILEFSDWVLKEAPKEGLRIFTENFIEVENLPRAKILDFLLKQHKALAIPYLEHVIDVWKDENVLIHNVLITQYREKIQQLLESLKNENDNQSENEVLLENYRSKLYNLLKLSENYSPDAVLKDFPTNVMLEERALILGRLKRHDEVLKIYLQILGDMEKAIKYCEEQYDDENEIFVMLLKVILKPSKEPIYKDLEVHPDYLTPNEETILSIFNKYAKKIPPAKIIQYIPDEMPVDKLKNYMNTVLRTEMAQRNHNLIVEGLLSAKLERTKKLIVEERRKFVEINEFSVCPECKKCFKNQSAFVRYPNGEVVHLLCHDKRVQLASSNKKSET